MTEPNYTFIKNKTITIDPHNRLYWDPHFVNLSYWHIFINCHVIFCGGVGPWCMDQGSFINCTFEAQADIELLVDLDDTVFDSCTFIGKITVKAYTSKVSHLAKIPIWFHGVYAVNLEREEEFLRDYKNMVDFLKEHMPGTIMMLWIPYDDIHVELNVSHEESVRENLLKYHPQYTKIVEVGLEGPYFKRFKME